jgi:hypothetical protein
MGAYPIEPQRQESTMNYASKDPKFQRLEEVWAIGEAGEPGYTIITVTRSPFRILSKNHLYTVVTTFFSGHTRRDTFTSVVDTRGFVADAIALAGGAKVQRTGDFI